MFYYPTDDLLGYVAAAGRQGGHRRLYRHGRSLSIEFQTLISSTEVLFSYLYRTIERELLKKAAGSEVKGMSGPDFEIWLCAKGREMRNRSKFG